jgi:hypothetical protein
MATTTFNDLITFSRGSNATVTGPNGLIQWAPANLLTNSEDFEAAVWTKTGATLFPNQNVPGGTLGPELVTNGDFSSGTTGWSLQTATAAVAGGEVTVTSTGVNYGQIYQSVTTVAGTWYRISATMRAGTASSVNLRAETTLTVGNLLVQTTTSTSNVVITGYFLATGASTIIGCANSNTSNGTGIFDNISVQAVTPAAATAPDGTQTADALTEDNSTGGHLVLANPAPLNVVQTLAFTIYAKAGTRRFIALGSNTRDNGGAYVAFDLQNGTAGAPFGGNSSSVINSSVIAVGNGWYRCQMSLAASSGGSGARFIAAIVTSLTPTFFTPTVPESYTGNGTGSVLIWGAQAEYGTTATTYNNTSVRNLLGFSEAFDNAGWTKSSTSVVTGAQANPVNGLFNAQKMMENTGGGTHRVQQGFTSVTGVTYTFSCYAKAAERTWVYLYDDMANGYAFFNLANGTVGTVAAGWSSASITSVGNGWYRVSATVTEAAGALGNQLIGLGTADNTFNYTGDGNSGVYIYGAQLSNSASLDPYVPTPGAAPSSTAYYAPRFDYDPVTLLPRGLLIEEQRTNLVLYSEQFDNAAWSEANVGTISPGTFTAPDGTATADRMVATVGAGAHTVFTTTAVTAATGANHALSVYVKKDAYRFVYLCQSASTNNNITAIFDLDGVESTATQTNVGSGSGTIASTSIQNVGNGWFRISLVGAVTGASRFCAVGFAAAATGNTINTDGNVTFTAAGTEAVLLWGAQLEAGAFATSYIPTIASTVTRSADAAAITGSLFSQWYAQPQGTFVFEGDSVGLGVTPYYSVDDTTSQELMVAGNNFLTQRTAVIDNNVSQATLDVVGLYVTNSPIRHAFAYSLNNLGISALGAAVVSDTSATIPTVIRFFLGDNLFANKLNGHIRSIRYVPVRAADFQLQALTAPPELLSSNIYDRFNDLVLDRAGQTIEVR